MTTLQVVKVAKHRLNSWQAIRQSPKGIDVDGGLYREMLLPADGNRRRLV